MVLLSQGSSHLCQAAWRCSEDPRGELARWLERGVGMLTLEVPRGREGAVWSSWRDILGNAGDIGNLQGVGEEDTEGGGQEESDGAISQEEEEEATEFDMDID